MKKDASIAQRIGYIIETYFKGNKSEFARRIDISEAGVRSYLNGTLPRADVLEKIVNNVAISCDWLLTGKGEAEYDGESISAPALQVKDRFPLKTDRTVRQQSVPLYDMEASAGLVALFDDQRRVPLNYISLPDLPACDGAVYVRGDSMYPLLKSGDIVLYKEVQDLEYGIFYGEMYLISFQIDGEEYVTIKYIQKSEVPGHIRLVSHNAHHSPKDIPVSMIRALALVKASVRYNSMR